MASSTAPRDPQEALERLTHFFAPQQNRQGWLARGLLAMRNRHDQELRDALVQAWSREGPIRGGLLAVAWRVHEFLDLEEPPDSPAPGQLLVWILAQQDKPGAFGEDWIASDEITRRFPGRLTGFFSPGPPPPKARIAPVTLPNGKVFRAEAAARFAVSCVALRAVLRAGLGGRADIRAHLQSLTMLLRYVTWGLGYLPPDAVLVALHALAAAGPGQRENLVNCVSWVVSHQQDDGTWPHADLFVVLEVLVAARTREGARALERAMRTLLSRQRLDGTFGPTAKEERALIGLRTLLQVEEPVVGPAPHRRAGE